MKTLACNLLVVALMAPALAEPIAQVRTDFAAALNSAGGWADVQNDAVTVVADRPFRLRFEVEVAPGAAPAPREYALQFRRNAGEWVKAEAHDFPHPLRELDLEFDEGLAGQLPRGWEIAAGKGKAVVAGEAKPRYLLAEARREPLVVLHTPAWPVTEVATAVRFPAEAAGALALLMGYADAENHLRATIDARAGTVRILRRANGRETVLAEQRVALAPGQWHKLELQVEDGSVELAVGEDLELSAPLDGELSRGRIGFEVPPGGHAELQPWSIAGEARTPRASIVACPALDGAVATADLLKGSTLPFAPGSAVSLGDSVGASARPGTHTEFEWPVVVRRYADGALANEEGDRFEFRMVEADGKVVAATPTLRLTIPPGHLGGTYVETPGRVGPWSARNGDLYFVMEPAETHNVFMMMKSSDGGRTWREVDVANRPRTSDLESVDGRQVGDTLHLIHQVTETTHYHTFRTSDHPTHPDTWAVRDEVAATTDSVAQGASLAVRSDGSVVAFHVADTINYTVRGPGGGWSAVRPLHPENPAKTFGPKAVLGARDAVHVAYYAEDGTVWYRRMLADGTLNAPQVLASGLGRTRAEYGAVLPLVYIPATDMVVVLYRQADGALWERRIAGAAAPTPAVKVTDRAVLQQAVDSQQPEADVVWDGGALRVLFVDESSRSLFSTHDRGGWKPARLEVSDIRGSWVRGNVYRRPDGRLVLGYVYDAGSEGGAGMNRYGEMEIAPGG